MSSTVGEPRALHLAQAAVEGLRAMYLPESREFVQTTRGRPGPDGPTLAGEGTSLRYGAIVALGLGHSAKKVQMRVLDGQTLNDLIESIVSRAASSKDPGAVALAAWAAAEAGGVFAASLFPQLACLLRAGAPLPTVDTAWMLTAAIAARDLGDTEAVITSAQDRLLAAQGAEGIFSHALPASSQGHWRAHVGCFADQIYPIQALARLHQVTGDEKALEAANSCARQICGLQGPQGQWWWHYDARTGAVIEGFPVYSVHQHGMAPMGLADLRDAGGDDHTSEVLLGLKWIDTHPETVEPLVDDRLGVIWRKVGRREPPKAVRRLKAVTTAVRPGLHPPLLDRLMPPGPIDHECRPYELGWLLYAWCDERHSNGTTSRHGEDMRQIGEGG